MNRHTLTEDDLYMQALSEDYTSEALETLTIAGQTVTLTYEGSHIEVWQAGVGTIGFGYNKEDAIQEATRRLTDAQQIQQSDIQMTARVLFQDGQSYAQINVSLNPTSDPYLSKLILTQEFIAGKQSLFNSQAKGQKRS